MATQERSPARALALIALVGFGLALILILSSGLGGDDEDSSNNAATQQEQRDLELAREKRRRQKSEERREGQGKLPQGVYVVKTGDTLGSIAEKTGIPVEKLQELNPELDPQALVSGQKIKLRE
ncbi:MAG: LysM domain-containing protein [Actinomycetota bacterium]|nr:LysM domain-containing protein [Actinomycetota bacterium]